ncbi:hypothetical protein [Gimesia fumaroli]|uniref:Uncharacterized protein n=1 Tax=Gimesia fumaroli TaxID=2527976 RepID=A0A518I6R9_9PLAN|nr:hypothetical protein [Gimesia fumaroli]QDV48786.1 hypothetical protein Enr17x_08000 [Gimesia fumaroli]
MERDKRHLQILSKLQIIYGILNLFVSFYFYKVTSVMVRDYQKVLEESNPEVQVGLLLGFGFILFLLGVVVLFCIILTGQSLARYENYQYCLIIAVLECLIFPIGTILGIYTILVLRRASVKELFSVTQAEAGKSSVS